MIRPVGLMLMAALLTAASGSFGAASKEPDKMLQNARITLDALGKMEQAFKQRHGRYTDDIGELAQLTEDPIEFIENTLAMFDSGIRIVADRDSYVITGAARDKKKTKVSVSGPSKAGRSGLSREAKEFLEAVREEIKKRPDRLSRFMKEASPKAAAQKMVQAALSPDSEGAAHVGGVEIAGKEYFNAILKDRASLVKAIEKALKER